MKNKIEVIPICRQNSLIKVYKNGKVYNNIVCNNGWYPLEFWVKHYTDNLDKEEKDVIL